MMEGSIQFCLLAVLLLATINSAEAQKIESHFKLGGTMVLRPPVAGAITSIVWKFKGNLVAEWAVSGVPLTYYGGFDGRTTLNTENGELEINNMSKDDIGEYVVEINNKVQPQRYEPVEIKDVPQPSVIVRPVACGSTTHNCTLACGGDITGAGDVIFYWRRGDGEWKKSEQDIEIINNDDTKKVKTFSCRMNNTFSEKDSKSEPNPFLEKAADNPSNGGTVAAVVIVILAVLGAIGGVGYWKRDVFMNRDGGNKGKQSEAGRTEGQDESPNPPTIETPLNTGNADT